MDGWVWVGGEIRDSCFRLSSFEGGTRGGGGRRRKKEKVNKEEK